MILGLDISTSTTGIALLDKEDVVFSEALKFDSSDTIEKRAFIFKQKLLDISSKHNIEDVVIEMPIMHATKKSQAHTIAILNIFNGMCRFIVYEIFSKEPVMMNVLSARSLVGIKIPRGIKNKRQKKQIVIDAIQDKYKESQSPFLYEQTKKGNYKPGTDDRADAIVLALSYYYKKHLTNK